MHSNPGRFPAAWGWSEALSSAFHETALAHPRGRDLIPARIVRQERDLYQAQIDDDRAIPASVRGRLRFDAASAEDFPAVGDWVALARSDGGDASSPATIEAILPRRSLLVRRAAGGGGPQTIAANVDTVLIATSLNEDLNPRRLERYVALAWDAGAAPAIALTKRDLVPGGPSPEAGAAGWEAIVARLEARFPGVPIHAVSARDPETLAALSPYVAPGRTAALVGSSGVGKSTLINALVGAEVLDTGGIREDDARGRHTTTSRSLWRSAAGGLVVDTPGMRELGLWDASEGTDHAFGEIVAFAAECRFANCAHASEPGCAVKAALESGELSPERWHSYRKLQREEAFVERKHDKAAASAEKQKWKRIHVQQRRRREWEEG